MNARGLPIVLAAANDVGDRALLEQAFLDAKVLVDLRLVNTGEDLLNYLHRRTPWENSERPDLILLDLDIPNGHEILADIKRDRSLQPIPVVVITGSRVEQDVEETYRLGANTYILKPASAVEMARVIASVGEFWFKICVLPRYVDH